MSSERDPLLFNALTGKKEAFRPQWGNTVRMYVCGPTVYDVCHLGHARSYVVFDVISRYLRSLGYETRLVINFTDVEERITARAKEAGMEPLEFADRKIQEFFQVMDPLGVERADDYPRVSQYVGQMIEVVERLLESGHAYRSGERIFFDVERAGGYGELLHGVPEEAMVPDPDPEVDDERKSPLDFELWDGTVKEEPLWESPFGRGRVGWHVECYVMSKPLGHPLDIKGGGADLVFPHHESTKLIASALGEELAKFYVHNAFLTFGRGKMSKSGGRYVSIAEALERHSPGAVRMYMLSGHYRENLSFTRKALDEKERQLRRLGKLVRRLSGVEAFKGVDDGRLISLAGEMLEEYRGRMADDIDTPSVLAAVLRFAEEAGSLREFGREGARLALEALAQVDSVLGLGLPQLGASSRS